MTAELSTSQINADTPIITLQNIGVTFGQRQALKDISLDIHRGKIITIIGPNGAGKTTLVKVILGLQKQTVGQRIVQRGLRIGYMPQKLHLNEMMPIKVERFLQLTNCDKSSVTEALTRTGVSHLQHAPLQSLSGGEMQRVLLARALLHKPHILVLDEPAQGVDISGQKELYKLITDIRTHDHCAVLMVSHDLHLVMAATNVVFCINQHFCCSGHPHQVKLHPSYLELFGSASDALAVYTHHHSQRCEHHDTAKGIE